MRICYIFNSSVPSSNPGSLQVIKTCEGLIKHNNEVELITPNTGQKLSIKKCGLVKIAVHMFQKT